MASKVTHNVNICVGVENKVQPPKHLLDRRHYV